VVHADAARTGFPADRFSAVASFAVLHHIESAAIQDQVFAELFRVLRPGGALVGSDGYDNESTRQAHTDDVFVPVDPQTLAQRLGAVGFGDVAIEDGEYNFRFCARKPFAEPR
jgi:SAM-dependent methyltransferase